MPQKEAESTTTSASHVDTFAHRVAEFTVGPARLLVLPTPVQSIVSWRSSFRTYPDFANGEDLIQDLTVSLLDKGTKHRDRFVVAEVLENRGAQLKFSGNGFKIECSGRALRDDLPDVLEVVAEQLREPLLDPAEFDKALAQAAASLQQSMESTRKQAAAALARRLYPQAHPNYMPEPTRQLERLQTVTIDEVRQFHQAHFGANELVLAFVGDVEPDQIRALVEQYFSDWVAHQAPARFASEAADREPGQAYVPMPDKNNVDVRMGHALKMRRQDDDYLPLYLANYILGGNFSARLMATIRDEMGLTYGIGSSLSGISTDYAGHWQIGVTLSQENVDRGIEATRAEVMRFIEQGATAEELAEKKTTITGSFKVGLATTGGLALALLRNAERHFDVAYLDRFPQLVENVTLDKLHAVVQQHLEPSRFHLALAGQLETASAS